MKPRSRSSFPKPNQVIFRSDDENIMYKRLNRAHFTPKLVLYIDLIPLEHRGVTFLCGPAPYIVI